MLFWPRGFRKDQAEEVFQSSLRGAFADEIARQAAMRLQLMATSGKKGNISGAREDEIARQRALGFLLEGSAAGARSAGAREDELQRQAALRIQLGSPGEEEKQEFWLAIIDHLNQALPFVSGIVTNIVGARQQVEMMRLQIQQMETAGQQELLMLEARNYWLARMAKEQGVQIPGKTMASALVFGDALKTMGPQGQAYLNLGYERAFEMGANFGQGGEMRDGYMRLRQNDWAKARGAKNLRWVLIGGAVLGVLVLGGITTAIVVVATR